MSPPEGARRPKATATGRVTPKGGGATPTKARTSRPMPGGAEAIRAERRAARQAAQGADGANPRAESDVIEGRAVIGSAWIGTALFTLATVAAVVISPLRIVAVFVDLALLLAGSGLYLWGWGVAAGRSRDSQVSLWNLILLEDVAPKRIRARLLGALGVQILVAAATCWITAAFAFGWLVPVWGLAHCEYWGARYGVFLPRRTDETSRRRRR